MTPPVVLSIAATDSGGGAGLAADLATFAALGVHGACVVTAVTAQDTTGVHGIHLVPAEVVAAQLDAVLDDLKPAVIKTGMLGSAEVVRLVAQRCAGHTLVVDPVLRASTGAALADQFVVAAYRDHLLPVAAVVTPNADEYAALGRPSTLPVVLTGSGEIDVLHQPGQRSLPLNVTAVDTTNDHGTGCTHASALAAHLALGHELPDAVRLAHEFVAQQLTVSRDWTLGSGRGPIAHTLPTRPGHPKGDPS